MSGEPRKMRPLDVDAVVELMLARLRDAEEHPDNDALPTFDAVTVSVINELADDPSRLSSFIQTGVGIACFLAKMIADSGGRPTENLVRDIGTIFKGVVPSS